MNPAAPEERPHVLHLGPDVPGGMTTVMRGLLASPLADRYRLDIVPTHRGPGPARRLIVYLLALLHLTWWSIRGRGKIVHIHSTVRGSMYRKALCVLLASALRRRVVLHIHSGPGDVASFRAGLGAVSGALLRFSLRRADVVLAVSSASAAELEGAFRLSGIQVVPNAAPPVSPVAAVSGQETLTAVYLGGFANPVKGGTVMLEALSRLEPGELRVALAGPGELPALGRRLLDARPDIQWRGWLDAEAREELMGSASIFVLASTSEGLPMALLEAMARGLAIAATEVGGVPDVVDDGVEALVVAPGDPDALAGAIRRLAEDDALRDRLGRAARERASRMGADQVAERIDGLYRELLVS